MRPDEIDRAARSLTDEQVNRMLEDTHARLLTERIMGEIEAETDWQQRCMDERNLNDALQRALGKEVSRGLAKDAEIKILNTAITAAENALLYRERRWRKALWFMGLLFAVIAGQWAFIAERWSK